MAVKNPFTSVSPDTENYSRLFLREDELQFGLVTIFEAAAKLKLEADRCRAKHSLSWAEAKTLLSLSAKSDSVLNLGLRLAVTKQALTKTLRELESRGLIERKTDRRDKRRQIISLNAVGANLTHEMTQDMRALLTRAYRQSGADAVYGADQVLWSILEISKD